MSNQQATKYSVEKGAAWIRLDSPENRNALSQTLVSELIEHLEAANADGEVRSIVLTGNGPAFCAGADLKSGGDVARPSAGRANPFVRLMGLLREGDKPVICAVNGHAFGGGIGLVAACDIVVAVENAKFAFSEVRIGVIPAMISVVVLPKMGEHQTMRLLLTGERFAASEAKAYGLVHKVVDASQLVPAVQAEIDAIGLGGPIAVSEAKKLVRTVAKLPVDEAFEYAQAKIAGLFASEEAAEGMAAFVGKRPPAWVKT